MQDEKWVLFINHKSYPCNVGGLEIFNFYLIQELSKTYNTHVLTLCNKCEYNNSVTVHMVKKLKFSKLTEPLITFFFLLKNRKKIRLLHISFSKAYWTHWFIYYLVKRVLGLEYMVTIHGGRLSKWKPKETFKLFFKYAKSITGVSQRIIKEYNKRTQREIIFTPPLIPFNVIEAKNKFRNKWSIEPNDIVLLYVGSIKPLKAVDSLVEALGVLTKEKIEKFNLKVLIAGDGVLKEELEERVLELKLNQQVRFLGIVKREEVPQLYNLADIYTICSEFEGLPISLLEAFANGLPSVTSDAPGIAEISQNNKNSLTFKTRDIYDYSVKIELLLNNIELQNELKRSSNIYYKENFSYHILVEQFKKIIDSL